MSNPLESWYEEQRSVFLYRACAEAEAGTTRAELFRRLAGEAEAQAAIWRAQLTARGAEAPAPFVPDARTRFVARLIKWLGPRRIKSVLAAMKVRGMSIYGTSLGRDPGHTAPTAGATIEHRHRGLGGGNNLRAAVFGVNVGIVSNSGLILGIAGASPDPHVVLLSGVAGLAAGAFAMAAGEYVSVRSQRELYEYQIALERDELKEYPEAEAQELALIYVAKGLPQREAEKLAQRLVSDPEHALDTLAREELGLNPGELGSPVGAAASSFAAFAAGAAVPLAPFVFAANAAFPIAIGVTALALFGVGAVLSLFTGRSAWLSGLRTLALGALAGGVTFAIGRLVGVNVG
jgi:vacuolar iron transporter family protein